MGFKGVDIRQSGDRLVFRAFPLDSSGAKLTTGTPTLRLYEIQSDGTLKSYDFNDHLFKTTALTTATANLSHRTGNNATYNTGVWTYALTTVSGFTRGGTYLAEVEHSGASPTIQVREFQYGEGAGDLTVGTDGAGDANVKKVNNSTTWPTVMGSFAISGTLTSASNNTLELDSAADVFADSGDAADAIILCGSGGSFRVYRVFSIDGTTSPATATVYPDPSGAEGAAVPYHLLAGAIVRALSHDGDFLAEVGDVDTVEGSLSTLLGRLTSTRAGLLDNLNVGGLVASAAGISAITQAQRVRVLPPPAMERPDAGSTSFRVWIYVYNEQHQAEDLDGLPAVTAENNAAADRSANLGTVTKPAATTGIYYVDYTVASGHAVEGLVFKVAATEGGTTTNYAAASVVEDQETRTLVQQIVAKLPSKLYLAGTNNADGDIELNEATGTPADSAGVTTLLTNVAAVKSDTAAILLDTGTDGVVVGGDVATAATRFLTMISLDGSVYRFTANALELGPAGAGGTTQITVAPLQAQVITPTFTVLGATVRHLSCPQNAAATFPFAVTDGDGVAIDLSAKTLRFIVHDKDGTVLFSRETGGSGVTVSGDDNNVANVAVTATNTATRGDYLYKLWSISDDTVYASGDFKIPLAPKVAA